MGLLDEAKEQSYHYKPTCTLAALDPDLLSEINEALATPGVTDIGVERALVKRGVRIKAPTLGRHRRGDCTCEPS